MKILCNDTLGIKHNGCVLLTPSVSAIEGHVNKNSPKSLLQVNIFHFGHDGVP